MSSAFDILTGLRDQWQALRPLSAESDARLWKKIRLEWNYHSNHIEGNTLTYGETELLLLHGRTTGNHSHREYLEMKAHDAGIDHVRTLADDTSRLITEADIRDLNRIILKEPFWKAAETVDGQPTRKEIIPGQYKTAPNNVRLPNGDIFSFASVEDTPPRMTAFAFWVRQELESPALHPVAFAAKLHHDFVLIHPFDDGNGRVARLLVNYVLMRSGYLPLIVRTEDKAGYLTALRLADAGELSALIRYFNQLAEWSLNLGIKAAKGESIEEPSDLEKEIEIFIRNQQGQSERVVPRSKSAIEAIFNQGIRSLLNVVDLKIKKLEPLFATHWVSCFPGSNLSPGSSPAAVFEGFLRGINSDEKLARVMPFHVEHHFGGYRGQSAEPFGVQAVLRILFEDFQYSLEYGQSETVRKLYSEPILAAEAEAIATQMLADAFDEVKKRGAKHS